MIIPQTVAMGDNDDVFYLPVPDLKLEDLLNWQDPAQRKQRHLVHRLTDSKSELDAVETLGVSVETLGDSAANKKCFGKSVNINDETIALFRIGNEAHATQAKCPHMGGPLHLADIEELVPGTVSMRCPWHKWTFDLDTGHSISPPGRGLRAKVYPVQVTRAGDIRIGFDRFGPSAFKQPSI